MTVALRAHHLLCLLTYVGKGYTPAFTANFDRIAARLSAGEAAELVAGPDAICAPLCAAGTAVEANDEPHCRRASAARRDALALEAVRALLGQPLALGSRLTLTPSLQTRLRAAFADGRLRAACSGCEWHALCSAVAAEGYRGAKLR